MRFEVVRIPVPGLSICNFKASCKAVNAYGTRIPIRRARFFRRERLPGASRCRSVLGSDFLIACMVGLDRRLRAMFSPRWLLGADFQGGSRQPTTALHRAACARRWRFDAPP